MRLGLPSSFSAGGALRLPGDFTYISMLTLKESWGLYATGFDMKGIAVHKKKLTYLLFRCGVIYWFHQKVYVVFDG